MECNVYKDNTSLNKSLYLISVSTNPSTSTSETSNWFTVFELVGTRTRERYTTKSHLFVRVNIYSDETLTFTKKTVIKLKGLMK